MDRLREETAMVEGKPFRVAQCPVAPEPLLDGTSYDYADSFEVQLDRPDAHTAEQWVRTALEQAPPAVRRIVQFVHARVARFELGPDSDGDHVLGWRIVTSAPDVLHIETSGRLLRAVIVARATSPDRKVLTTFLFYEWPFSPVLWQVIRPLHRRIARLLLVRAAESFTRVGGAARDEVPAATLS